jgi:ribosomal protein S19E (S16A)
VWYSEVGNQPDQTKPNKMNIQECEEMTDEVLAMMQENGWVEEKDGLWSITPKGVEHLKRTTQRSN